MGRRLTDRERAWRSVSEKDLQQTGFDAMALRGWTYQHVNPPKGLRPDQYARLVTCEGFPDVVAAHEATTDMIAVEFKRETEQPTDAQRWWLEMFDLFGIDTFVIRPSNLDTLLDRLANPRRFP